ncbi:hypothetical protein AWW66_09195 [Micromonospora rosaria]|uniref:Peptidase inhibitor family I36 n=1 Tax=Micromonospora rosaria TaxID=47874 RepID=A0A136PV69_9ACTN|nr:peptidase inhibitor family I36 protein [Micromonospora rosaria]KXK62302.1 hypothetical protein AWW66_09195 [Micromonospora rosaria]
MSMRSRMTYGLAVVALTATTVLTAATPGTATPATATPRAGYAASAVVDCPAGALCLFDQTGYVGTRLTVASAVPGGTCVSLVDHGFAGQARSAFNTHSSAAALFANDDCVGGPYQVPGNGGVTDLGSFRATSVWVP